MRVTFEFERGPDKDGYATGVLTATHKPLFRSAYKTYANVRAYLYSKNVGGGFSNWEYVSEDNRTNTVHADKQLEAIKKVVSPPAVYWTRAHPLPKARAVK